MGSPESLTDKIRKGVQCNGDDVHDVDMRKTVGRTTLCNRFQHREEVAPVWDNAQSDDAARHDYEDRNPPENAVCPDLMTQPVEEKHKVEFDRPYANHISAHVSSFAHVRRRF